VLREEKVYVPKDEELRMEVIQLHHNVPVAGHGERWKTVELVTRNYWWLEVMRDVGRYVEGCDLCQRMKNRAEELAGKLKLSEVPEKLWTYLMVDFITKLPVVAEKDVILVVCDRLFKMTHFVATTEGTSVEGLARLFRDNVWKLHGLPESVVSDRGPQFAAELMKELNRILGIKTKLLTVFHPQTDVLWQPLDTQGLMISLTSKPQRRSIMWEFTRELDNESLLNYHPIYTKYIWSMLQPHVRLISYSRPPCCIHVP